MQEKKKLVHYESLGGNRSFQWSYLRTDSMATGAKFTSQSTEMCTLQSSDGIIGKKPRTCRWLYMVSLVGSRLEWGFRSSYSSAHCL